MKNPVDTLRWVPIKQVEANKYNPNQVAQRELQLLYTSIRQDGWTQPIVTIYNSDDDNYIIVDGFHRWMIPQIFNDIYKRDDGKVPIVTIEKSLQERMASTIRHNRARGKHTIAGMSHLIFDLVNQGLTDEEICDELGLEPDEFVRLKYLTGFEKYFKDVHYNKAWKTDRQIQIEKEQKEQ